MANDPPEKARAPHGGAGTLPLVDLLQVWAMNRFSGLVAVTSRGATGHVYYEAGEIVHAEAAGLAGEAAMRAMLTWPDTAADPFPNTTTLKRTIQKAVSHLLLDTLRAIDEQGPGGAARPAHPPVPPPRAPAPPAPSAPAGAPSALQRIQAIPGVAQVVRFGPSGRPVGEASSDAEALAARGLYLAMTCASSVAQAFGLSNLSLAALHVEDQPLVLIQNQGQYLCVAARPHQPLDPVIAELRNLLGRTVVP